MTKSESAVREEFKKLVIMGNYPECKIYEEAQQKFLDDDCMRYGECYVCDSENTTTTNGLPITIDRICISLSNALKNADVINCHINQRGELVLRIAEELIDLKLGKIDDELDISTITNLIKILKP